MGTFSTHIRRAFQIGPLLAVLLVTGCAGMEPYEPRNEREEGPKQGLLSGSDGEFVIFRRAAEPDTGKDEE